MILDLRRQDLDFSVRGVPRRHRPQDRPQIYRAKTCRPCCAATPGLTAELFLLLLLSPAMFHLEAPQQSY